MGLTVWRLYSVHVVKGAGLTFDCGVEAEMEAFAQSNHSLSG